MIQTQSLPIDSIISDYSTLNSTVSEFSAPCSSCLNEPKPFVANQNLTLAPNQFNKFSTDKAGYLNVYFAWNNYNNSVSAVALIALFVSVIFIIIAVAAGNFGLLGLLAIPIVCFAGCICHFRRQKFNVLIVFNSSHLMVFRGTPGTRIGDLRGEVYSFDTVPIILEKYFSHWTNNDRNSNGRSRTRRRHHFVYYISFHISRHAPSRFQGQELFMMERAVYDYWAPCPPDLDAKFQSLKNGEASNMFGFPLLLVSNFNVGNDGLMVRPRTRIYERYIVKPLQQGNIGTINIQGVQLNPNLPTQPNNMQGNQTQVQMQMGMQQNQMMMQNNQQMNQMQYQQPMQQQQMQQPMQMQMNNNQMMMQNNNQQMMMQNNNQQMNQMQYQQQQQQMNYNYNQNNQQNNLVNYQQQQQPMQQNQYQGNFNNAPMQQAPKAPPSTGAPKPPQV